MKQPKIPVKMLTTLTILMVFLCVGSYLLSPKWQAVRAEYQRQRDPLHQFASQQTPEAQLQALQDKIRANPQNSEQWALLGEYYLWQNDYSNSLLAYRQALQLHGENAELYAALATVLYYQASQHMTAQTRAMIDKALALDSNEDPYYSAALLQGGVRVLKDGTDLNQTGSFYLAARPYAEKNGAFIQGVLATFSEADALTRSQREQSIALLAKTMGVED